MKRQFLIFQYLIVLYGQVFPDDGYAQSRSDAGAADAVFAFSADHFFQKGNADPGPRVAQGMALGDGTAIHVDHVVVQPQFFFTGNNLGGKRFIDLNQTHIAQIQVRSFQ